MATTHFSVGCIVTPILSEIRFGGTYLKEGQQYKVIKVVNGRQVQLARLSDGRVHGPWNMTRFKLYSPPPPQEADMPTTVNSFFRVSLFVPPSEDLPDGEIFVDGAIIPAPSAGAAYQKVLVDKAPSLAGTDVTLVRGEVTEVKVTHPC